MCFTIIKAKRPTTKRRVYKVVERGEKVGEFIGYVRSPHLKYEVGRVTRARGTNFIRKPGERSRSGIYVYRTLAEARHAVFGFRYILVCEALPRDWVASGRDAVATYRKVRVLRVLNPRAG